MKILTFEGDSIFECTLMYMLIYVNVDFMLYFDVF